MTTSAAISRQLYSSGGHHPRPDHLTPPRHSQVALPVRVTERQLQLLRATTTFGLTLVAPRPHHHLHQHRLTHAPPTSSWSERERRRHERQLQPASRRRPRGHDSRTAGKPDRHRGQRPGRPVLAASRERPATTSSARPPRAAPTHVATGVTPPPHQHRLTTATTSSCPSRERRRHDRQLTRLPRRRARTMIPAPPQTTAPAATPGPLS